MTDDHPLFYALLGTLAIDKDRQGECEFRFTPGGEHSDVLAIHVENAATLAHNAAVRILHSPKQTQEKGRLGQLSPGGQERDGRRDAPGRSKGRKGMEMD